MKLKLHMTLFPGTVFKAKVVKVLPVLAEGQVQPTGNLINPMQTRYPGRVPVLLSIDG